MVLAITTDIWAFDFVTAIVQYDVREIFSTGGTVSTFLQSSDIISGLVDHTCFRDIRIELVVVAKHSAYGLFIPFDDLSFHPIVRKSGNEVRAVLDEVAVAYWEIVSGFYDDVRGNDPTVPVALPFSRSLDVHGEVLSINEMTVFIEHGQQRGTQRILQGEFIFLCERMLTIEDFFPHEVQQNSLH